MSIQCLRQTDRQNSTSRLWLDSIRQLGSIRPLGDSKQLDGTIDSTRQLDGMDR